MAEMSSSLVPGPPLRGRRLGRLGALLRHLRLLGGPGDVTICHDLVTTRDTVLQTRVREPVSGCETPGEERVCLLPCCRTVAGQCVDTGDITGDSHG